MKLHVSGVKVPKLGSIQDRVIREYMTKASQLEIKKMEFQMLTAFTNPAITDAGKQREWSTSIKKSWNRYLSLELGYELPEQTEQEVLMMEYYQSVVKRTAPKLGRTTSGGLQVTGLTSLNDL